MSIKLRDKSPTNITSFRLEEDIIRKLDLLVEKKNYQSRSALVRGIFRQVIKRYEKELKEYLEGENN